MIDACVAVLILLSSFNEGLEVTNISGGSEIVINGNIPVILGLNRKRVGQLTVIFFLLQSGIEWKQYTCLDYFLCCLA
jgi:hypothetical protein